MKNKTVWLVDSNIYVYEAWNFCKTKAVDDKGRDSRGVVGFLHFLYQLLTTEHPATIAFAFDEKLKCSHRKALYPAYKAHRKPLSTELALQFHYCRAFLDSLGFYQSSSHYYEADDLIGTWVEALHQQHYAVNIITADKDLLQLIEGDDYWWSYQKNYKHSVKSFHKRFRIYPYQVADQIALAGDKSDNIPGVKGVGMSTAAKLLRKFGSIEAMLKRHTEIPKMHIRYAQQLHDEIMLSQKTLHLAQQLTAIKRDITEANTAAIFHQPILQHSAFKTLCQQLLLTDEEQEKWIVLMKQRVLRG